ncbi:hypothetical protein Tco_0161640 [Tanacetum coccineum]
MADQDTPPPTITAMKIPIIKKGEYDIWSMRMRQYICHTDHNLWDIIVNGDLEDEATPSGEQSSPPVPKTAKQLAARRNQERIKSILLLAIPDEYLLKFHNVPDAKSLWAAIKSRFGGNEESKKMQKNVLKHQFENFVTASNETLDKAYDRFQKLISQLEIHGAYVSKEDINQKFLRSLPPSWSQIALIMRNKPDIDEVDIDDLYNNLRVYEDELKRSSGSNSASQNLAFLSSENTNSTNEVSTASGDFGVSTAGGINQVPSTPSAHDIAYSFLAQPTTSPQLENEDFQQMDGDDLEELDLRWQVAMLTVRDLLTKDFDVTSIHFLSGQNWNVILVVTLRGGRSMDLRWIRYSWLDNNLRISGLDNWLPLLPAMLQIGAAVDLRSYEAPLPEGNTSGEVSKQTLGCCGQIGKEVQVKSLRKSFERGNPEREIHEREVNRFCYPTKSFREGQEEKNQSYSWRQLVLLSKGCFSGCLKDKFN